MSEKQIKNYNFKSPIQKLQSIEIWNEPQLIVKLSDWKEKENIGIGTTAKKEKKNDSSDLLNPVCELSGSFTEKVNSLAENNENIGDDSLNTMVNTPLAIESTNKKVSSLIKPLRRENYRNQIMPSKVEIPIDDYITPHKKVTSSNQKWGSASAKRSNYIELENTKESNLKDTKIAQLELKNSELVRENAELRNMINKVMLLKFQE